MVESPRASSPARAFLENMRLSRARKGIARTLSKREIEERLDEMLRRSGETALQRLRDDAREIAGLLRSPDEFQRLDILIGTLLGTRDAPLESPVAPVFPTTRSGSICSSASLRNLREAHP